MLIRGVCECNYWNPYAELCGWMDGESLSLWGVSVALEPVGESTSLQLLAAEVGAARTQLWAISKGCLFPFLHFLSSSLWNQVTGFRESRGELKQFRFEMLLDQLEGGHCSVCWHSCSKVNVEGSNPTLQEAYCSQGARDYLDQANKKTYFHGSSNHRKPPQHVLGGSCFPAFICLLCKQSSGCKCPWCHQEWPMSPAVPRGLAATPGVVSLLLDFSFALVGKKMLWEASLDAIKSQSHLFTWCQLTNVHLILKYPRHKSELSPRVQFFFFSIAS